MTSPITSPALLYVPLGPAASARFRVMTPDCHSIAVTAEPALAAATALAVARHHPARYATVAGSDGRWMEVTVTGTTTLAPHTADTTGWPTTVRRALGRLAPTPSPTPEGEAP